jgi:hypothetical protein
MNDKQLDMILGYLNEGTEINEADWLVESIKEEINRFSFVNEKIEMLNEGALSTIKEKIGELIKKIIQMLKNLKDKVVTFIKKVIHGGGSSAKKVEENFKIASDGTKMTKDKNGKVHVHGIINKSNIKDAINYAMQKESCIMLESEEDKVAKANREIYELFEKHQPVYMFRTNAIPWSDEIDDLEDDLDDILSGNGSYHLRFTNKLMKSGGINKYFESHLSTYSSNGTISANKDYVNNGLNYFMDDFKTIDKYINSVPKYIDRITKIMEKAKNNYNNVDEDTLDKLKKFITEASTMKNLLDKYLSELLKTRSVIVKASEIAKRSAE